MTCRRKPIDPSDYRVTLSPAEHRRLALIFPDGVCDWTRPGVGQQPLQDTWLTFD